MSSGSYSVTDTHTHRKPISANPALHPVPTLSCWIFQSNACNGKCAYSFSLDLVHCCMMVVCQVCVAVPVPRSFSSHSLPMAQCPPTAARSSESEPGVRACAQTHTNTHKCTHRQHGETKLEKERRKKRG